MAKQSQLEQQILLAAEELFLDKGYDATSTTDIAKRVGCNQALVHYYFRTKEKLFEQIFREKSQLIFSYIDSANHPKMDFETSLSHFIDAYFDILSNNRRLPLFIIKELIMNEERRKSFRMQILQTTDKLGYYAQWDKLVKEQIAKGNIRQIETIDLTLNVISLIIFTFISLPLYSDMFLQNEEQVNEYLLHRKEEVTKLILNGIRA